MSRQVAPTGSNITHPHTITPTQFEWLSNWAIPRDWCVAGGHGYRQDGRIDK